MRIASFFSGCGGLDFGFKQAGFDVVWANEYDKSIYPTYEANHPDTFLCKADIRNLKVEDIPTVDGFIGGPPCQSWSYGGAHKGLEDDRGRLFITYIDIIKAKLPKFFVIENVDGILSNVHFQTFLQFIHVLEECGYNVYYQLLNAVDYKIPQDRKRVFIVGFRADLQCQFSFPLPSNSQYVFLRQAIGDITEEPNYTKNSVVECSLAKRFYNHDCYIGPYDKKFMARNRVRSWDEVSFTIQAQAKNCPLHPQAPKMEFIDSNTRQFKRGYEHLYRRLSVRECARIQTFPDRFRFYYDDVKDGYKMVGNAVPPRLAFRLAESIKFALSQSDKKKEKALVGYYKDDEHLSKIIGNSLYYIRTGFGRGAITLQPNNSTIKYLVLHNRSDIICFEVNEDSLKVYNDYELREFGFSPNHSLYLGIKLRGRISHPSWINSIVESIKGRSKTAPFIIDIP